ncbi:hypothetical protein GCM10009720_01840 [Yaniella flava]|uniref:Polymerase nucleotidyl transferase domain-containing protein n=2 Tax=Yaniella flava TaxID=287930 RepID=A0ABP5FHD0_9MICC
MDVDAISKICERHYVKSLTLFGSALTNDFDPEHSDYDFLVEFLNEAPSRIRARMGLKSGLERLLKRDVYLVIGYNFSNPYFEAMVQANKYDIYMRSDVRTRVYDAIQVCILFLLQQGNHRTI